MAYKVYLYKGDEQYLTASKIERVIKESKANELNITSYDCSEVPVEKAVYDALTPAFLGDSKVVIITNPVFLESEKAGSNHNLKILINYIENPMDNSCLIINASGFKVNEKLEVTKALMKKACVVSTNGISEVEFNGWIQRECQLEGVRIEKSACSLMYKSFGFSLERAKNEIDKAISYVGKNGYITENNLKDIISKGTTYDTYDLIKAIYAKNRTKMFECYMELTRYEKDVTILINMITKAFKDSLLVKIMVDKGYEQGEVASKMKVSTNRAYYMIKDASALNFDEIKRYISLLSDLDYNIKSGQIDKKIGFEQFLYSI